MSSTYEGWTNSATYLAMLYINQEAVLYKRITAMITQSALTAQYVASMISRVVVQNNDDDDSVSGMVGNVLYLNSWAEGDVNWQEIADTFNSEFNIQPSRSFDSVMSDIQGVYLQMGACCGVDDSSLAEIPAAAVSDELQEILTSSEINGCIVTIGRQLDRRSYLMVDEAMRAIGGKWNKKAKGHVFSSDPTDLIESIIESGTFEHPKKLDNFGFFPTPVALVQEMIVKAGLVAGMSVLEPHGGDGAIAVCAAEIVGYNNVVTVELQESNAETLRRKGFSPFVGDFLAFDTEQRFQCILMNPPFSKQQDIDHVLHAWKFVAVGGCLVSIMASSVKYRDNAKSIMFRAFLEQHGGVIEDNPEGSFKSSGTGVRTVTVTMRMAAAMETPSIQNFWIDENDAVLA